MINTSLLNCFNFEKLINQKIGVFSATVIIFP